MASSSQPTTLEEKEENIGEQLDVNVSSQLVTPEDGYEWRKYGQKYIRNIQKIRSYFKCRNKRCNAKKKVEWHPSDPNNLRIVYDGTHNHWSRSDSAQISGSMANQYDLSNQMFGQFSDLS